MDTRVGAVDVDVLTIPTDAPESDGTLEWNSTTLVVVHVRARQEAGIGYTYASTAAAEVINRTLKPIIVGADPFDIEASYVRMRRAVRNAGGPGIAATAISAVDVALWDLKARLLGLPILSLLGAVRDAVPVYGSGGFTSCASERLQRQLAQWVGEGIGAVKMKVGRHAGEDRTRVALARDAIGPCPGLFVDANGGYDRKQALSQAEGFAPFGVSWFEEPVSSDDVAGLRLLRDRAPAGMEIAAGEYGYTPAYFRGMADAVDVLQADATRCGGITGFLRAGALCDAMLQPLSAHTAPALHAHLGCAVSRVRNVEYFHDHVRIEQMLFEGAIRHESGLLRPDRSRPGLGITLRKGEAARFAA